MEKINKRCQQITKRETPENSFDSPYCLSHTKKGTQEIDRYEILKLGLIKLTCAGTCKFMEKFVKSSQTS